MNTNITKKECDPCYLNYGRGHRSIFNFNARRRHSGRVVSWHTKNTIGTKECVETSDASLCCGATSPIYITKHIEVGKALGNITKTKMFESHLSIKWLKVGLYQGIETLYWLQRWCQVLWRWNIGEPLPCCGKG